MSIIIHERFAYHLVPGCGALTTSGDVCDFCYWTPRVVDCGDFRLLVVLEKL